MYIPTLRLFFAAALLALAACSKSGNDGELRADQAVANVSAYNHTPDYIHQFYVDEGAGGSTSYPYSGGGSFVCCIVYPMQWRPGLTAKVRWTTSSPDPKATGEAAEEKWHEKTVPIDRYTEPGTTLNVHFMPGGGVRLAVSSKGAGHPDYPGPAAPEKPPGFPY